MHTHLSGIFNLMAQHCTHTHTRAHARGNNNNGLESARAKWRSFYLPFNAKVARLGERTANNKQLVSRSFGVGRNKSEKRNIQPSPSDIITHPSRAHSVVCQEIDEFPFLNRGPCTAAHLSPGFVVCCVLSHTEKPRTTTATTTTTDVRI